MRVSLSWQIVWAPALALLVAGVLLFAEGYARNELSARLASVSAAENELNQLVTQLAERHHRTVRRANEALLETKRENKSAILAWTSEHYLKEMERYAQDARQELRTVEILGADARLAADVDRLNGQLDRIMEQAHVVAPTLDALLSAVSTEDAEALLLATQELARADRSMQAVLRTTQSMVQRTVSWQSERALAAPAVVPRFAWLLLLIWAPLSLYIAQRPARRIRRLSQDAVPTPQPGAAPEEAALTTRLANLASQRDELDRTLGERVRETDRALQQSRRAEHELALQRIYSESLTNSLRTAIVVTDATLVIKAYNRMARQSLGMTEQELDSNITEHPLYRALSARTPSAQTALAHALTTKDALRFEGLTYDGKTSELVLDVTITPYLDESGAARGLLWIADDVTEAVRVKGKLLLAERLAAVGRLSAQVAHEVRNPLSAIGLNAELLEDDFAAGLPDAKRIEAVKLLRAIGAEVERLTQVTEGYLQLARLPHPNASDTDVNLVVTDLATMLREEMTAYGIELTLDLVSPAPRASVDAGQLRQALLNILRNSREAMGDGGSVTVRTKRENGTVSIEVADTGTGIPDDVIPRIFEPFFTTKPSGTGLGLSLTQQIIGEHGGSIRANKNAPRGAVVSIDLPALS